jgi:hypothetical protein
MATDFDGTAAWRSGGLVVGLANAPALVNQKQSHSSILRRNMRVLRCDIIENDRF